jgi:hypothetical protein
MRFSESGKWFVKLIFIVSLAWLYFFIFLPCCKAGEIQPLSKWDETFLNVELHDVHVNSDTIESAWMEIRDKYLLRANLYLGDGWDAESKAFSFNKETATGKELIEAFLATYPTYIYTQDSKTGVIWIYPKRMEYEDILSEKIKINHPAYQVSAVNAVIIPLCKLLHLQPMLSNGNMQAFNYGVDLPAGVFTARDIVNFCLIANPTKAFRFYPSYGGYTGGYVIILDNLEYRNPLALPRAAAVKFWEVEIGKPTNEIPTAAELSVAMSDVDPKIRFAARSYHEAAPVNYNMKDIIEKSGSPENAVWAALGIEASMFKGIYDPQFLVANSGSGFTTSLRQIKDPGLALVTSLELAREKQGTNYLYLDSIVSQHKFTEAEIANIKPDVYRLAHESPLMLDKLKAMKLDVPEFSPKALSELADTNLFTLVPMEKK